jgi:hypothetical protein
MELGHFVDEGQSKPGTFLAGVRSGQGVEALEDPGLCIVRYPRALIVYPDHREGS